MDSDITYVDFSKRCACLAALVASWAAESLDCGGQASMEDVSRFTDAVRDRLNWIVECSGRKGDGNVRI